MTGEAARKKYESHPFVTRNKDICNGSPVIKGTRTRVIDIVIEYEMLGHSPDEIIDSHPHLNLSLIHDALSYYYENRDEIDRKINQDQELIAQLKKKFPSKTS